MYNPPQNFTWMIQNGIVQEVKGKVSPLGFWMLDSVLFYVYVEMLDVTTKVYVPAEFAESINWVMVVDVIQEKIKKEEGAAHIIRDNQFIDLPGLLIELGVVDVVEVDNVEVNGQPLRQMVVREEYKTWPVIDIEV